MSKVGETFDRYVIEAELGEGGMGRVYRAFDPRLGRRVALKLLLEDGAKDAGRADAAARMQREARAAAAFSHPNVVAIYDVGEVAGAPFIAMELVSGTTLRSCIGVASVSDAQKLAWLLDVARGLGAAHRAGLVHRDIKPENAMITTDGIVKILDFGTARRSDGPSPESSGPTLVAHVPAITGAGLVIGTVQYMAPEQLRGDALDGRADQFAWGVMAWEVLAGRLPWPPGGGAQLITSVLSLAVPALDEVRPGTDRRTVDAIARALSKGREERFETMEALLGAIEGSREIPIVVRSSPEVGLEVGLEKTSARAAASSRPPLHARRARASRARLASITVGVVTLASVAGALVVQRQRAAATTAATRAAAAATPGSTRGACATSAECAARSGKPSLCRKDDGACVPLEPEGCKAFGEASDLSNDDTVWIGAITRDTDYAWSWGTRAFDMARREISRAGGLPPRPGSDRRRPFGIIACRAGADEVATARSLVELRVPVVVGLLHSVEAVASVFLPHDVAVITTSGDERVTRVQPPDAHPRLVWRAQLAASAFGDAVGAFVTATVASAKPPADAGARVAILTSRSEGEAQLVDALLSAVKIDGRSAGEASDSIRQFVIDAASSEPSAADGERIALFGPTVVVSTVRLSGAWLDGLERAWPSSRPRPIYVTPLSGDAATLSQWSGVHGSRRRRFFFLDAPSTTDGNVKFAMRFNGMYGPDLTVTPGTAPSVAYDPVYVAALAVVAAGDRPITGHAVADGIARLVPPGPVVTVGPARLYEAFDALGRGERIDLDGAGSPLDFDVATGESASRIDVYCLKETPTGIDAVESGLGYESKSRSLTGALRCR